MSQDFLTIGSTMRIPLLYREEYLQWVESNKTGKHLWDALARNMLGSEYGEQDRKVAVLYEYETFKATEGELFLNTYIRYLQMINDLKKCGYSKDNCELNFKFLNNLQPEWKQYATMMRHNKNLMDINIDALYNILKENQGDVNDDIGSKKKTLVVTSDLLALIAEKTKVSKSKEKVVVSSNSEGSDADDFSELKKITALLMGALERKMRGSRYAEQDMKAAILYEYETFKATEGEQLLDTYLGYLQVINDLKRYGYKKDNCELNYKFLNNLQLEWKQYGTLMRQTKNLIDINIDSLYNILKQNQGYVNDALGYKKKAVVVTSNPLALVAEKMKVSKHKDKVEVQTDAEGSDDEDIASSSSTNKKPEYVKSVEKKEYKKADEKKRDMRKVKCYNCKKEGHFAKDCNKVKVKDYNYYKTKMLLAKKDSDEQVLLAEDQAWMESSSDYDQEINANMVFMAQIK
uniref:CCHC-type domain-containing protein n=1 Tax=Tanacetum cinerariifolium TaxID=118510 RepID=A0A699J017_TANCI|nr:hypothetical protein [Tanacetum cinerariifolium]